MRPSLEQVIDPILRGPLGRMLLLSLCLHAAVLMLIQPQPFPKVANTVVINARLVAAAPATPSPRPAEPAAKPAPPSKMVEPPAVSAKPAPAPALPRTPVPVVTQASEPAPAAKPAPQPVAEAPPAPAPETKLPSVPVMVDTHWYQARQLDVQPRASHPINPVYPPAAIRMNRQGKVKLKLRIDESGAVRDVEVEESSSPGVFDESALEAFKRGHFEPAIRNGRPVRAEIEISVSYELNGE